MKHLMRVIISMPQLALWVPDASASVQRRPRRSRASARGARGRGTAWRHRHAVDAEGGRRARVREGGARRGAHVAEEARGRGVREHELRGRGAVLRADLRDVALRDERDARGVEAVRAGHHALAEARRDDRADEEAGGGEDGDVPLARMSAARSNARNGTLHPGRLERAQDFGPRGFSPAVVFGSAAGGHFSPDHLTWVVGRSRVVFLRGPADARLDEWAGEAAAVQHVLDIFPPWVNAPPWVKRQVHARVCVGGWLWR
ncbi:hypothetical protein GGX14DRAFT_667463 [Mycena pura]|uniref:Uncharacterized protein n=1 Tax=Mycena pura TaxID=153505 RepID=A0AAD6UY25_9AGAR|nr:hypothetical protein GGX14DRAFT_667463 [Mycena pura]